MRRLIINADDFGLTRGINRAIFEAHEHGVVSSATLMANGAGFDDAVALAKTMPGLSIGCHVSLIDGPPLLASARIPSLVKTPAENPERFREQWSRFAAAALAGGLVAEQIEAEAIAQIRKLQLAGIALSHLDTHKHTHILPQVLKPLLQAAKKCGVGALRNPFEPMNIALLPGRSGMWKRRIGTWMLRAFAPSFRRSVRAAGLKTPQGSVGIVATGSWDFALLSRIVEALPDGTWELVCHPGYFDAELGKIPTKLRESRAQELEFLTSTEARDLLARNHVELISYRDL